jgi:hypothetical protein
MNRTSQFLLLAITLSSAALLLAAKSPTADDANSGKPIVVRGLVRDIACPVQNHQSTSRHFNRKCAEACARQGSPLAILTDDGTMYMTISDAMPDAAQNEKLMPFVGKYVQATGTSYERMGLHTIAIKEIHEDKTVVVKDDLE